MGHNYRDWAKHNVVLAVAIRVFDNGPWNNVKCIVVDNFLDSIKVVTEECDIFTIRKAQLDNIPEEDLLVSRIMP